MKIKKNSKIKRYKAIGEGWYKFGKHQDRSTFNIHIKVCKWFLFNEKWKKKLNNVKL